MHPILLLALGLLHGITANAQINLGSAANFAVLGAQAVTNTGPTNLTGNLGIYPNNASSVTGFPPSMIASYQVSETAQNDAHSAYLAAKSLTGGTDKTGDDLGNLSLSPGVYIFASSVELTGNMTFDAKGDPNAQWVFQIGSTLVSATYSTVNLVNGAQACHIFWQVGSSATLNTGTIFAGNILALTSISVSASVQQNGGLFALNAAVTMISDNIISSGSSCASPASAAFQETTTTAGSVGFTSTISTTLDNTPTSIILVDIPTQALQTTTTTAGSVSIQALQTTTTTAGSVGSTSTISTTLDNTPTSIILVDIPTQALETTATTAGIDGFTSTVLTILNGAPTSIILIDVPIQTFRTRTTIAGLAVFISTITSAFRGISSSIVTIDVPTNPLSTFTITSGTVGPTSTITSVVRGVPTSVVNVVGALTIALTSTISAPVPFIVTQSSIPLATRVVDLTTTAYRISPGTTSAYNIELNPTQTGMTLPTNLPNVASFTGNALQLHVNVLILIAAGAISTLLYLY